MLWAGVAAVMGTALLTPTRSPAPNMRSIAVPPPPPLKFSEEAAAAASPVASATASMPAAPAAKASSAPNPSHTITIPRMISPPPVAGAGQAGQVLMNATGAQLASWNQTSSFCTQQSWESPSGTVSNDRFGDALVETNGQDGSCAGLVSPEAYSSAVIEAYIYFPPLPGSSGTIADWTSVWLTDQATWPADGELDAVEAEPATGVNAVAWHWGTADSPMSMSTDGFAPDGTLPKDGPNLTAGWHVVDIVYTKGFFAVYYDGKKFTSLSSSAVTGAPLNVLITTSVTPDNMQIEQQLGNAPQNSDSSPAAMAVKYVKVWSFK
ncbi:MAG: hypothetical protein ACRDNW_06210 [Trebonia sp.]